MTFAGIFLAGVSVAIFKASDFGTDPNSCFVRGVWNLAGIKYSYVYIAINALMLLGVFFLDRHFIGLGTVLNLFFMGIIVEKGMQLFDRYLPERTFGVRVLLMCIAVVMMCFASALYFTADMGVSAYDAYALILDKRTRIPFRMCRIGTDVITTAAGFFMGAVVGAGTLVTAFFMGPLIEFSTGQWQGRFFMEKRRNRYGSSKTKGSCRAINVRQLFFCIKLRSECSLQISA